MQHSTSTSDSAPELRLFVGDEFIGDTDSRAAGVAQKSRQQMPYVEPAACKKQLRSVLSVTAAMLLLGTLALLIDLPLANIFLQEREPKVIRKFLELCETFSHAFGVLLILVAIYWIDRKSRNHLWRIGTAAIVGGMVANLGKLGVERIRPKYFDFEGGVATTFGQWLPLTEAGTQMQSFPSAHAATAFSFAVLLCWRFPHARWLFLTFAALAAFQRVSGYAHYLSDALWGAAIGYAVGHVFVMWRPLNRLFGRIENRGAPELKVVTLDEPQGSASNLVPSALPPGREHRYRQSRYHQHRYRRAA